MSDAPTKPDLPTGEGEEALLTRHRKEKKELQAKIQALKKAKVDKKRKKEQQDEIARMEADMESRHADELNKLNSLRISETAVGSMEMEKEDTAGGEDEQTKQPKLSKAQRRREKKSQEDKDREILIKAEEASSRNNCPRLLEEKKITELLMDRGLVCVPVPADGDCLYNAVKHQLARIGVNNYDTAELRQMTADYIEDNKDSIIFYMTNPDTGDILNDDEFRKYCHLVRDTKAWGGEIEVKALSSRLKCPIEIIQASGTSPVHGEEEDPSRKLVLTYHRHMYRLGEHYNSTMPVPPYDEGNENEAKEDDG